MELLLVLVIALLLLKPSDVAQLARILGKLLALKRQSHTQLKQLFHEVMQHAETAEKNSPHEPNR